MPNAVVPTRSDSRFMSANFWTRLHTAADSYVTDDEGAHGLADVGQCRCRRSPRRAPFASGRPARDPLSVRQERRDDATGAPWDPQREG